MRRVVWADEARAELVSIRNYIGWYNEQAASRIAARLVAFADSLADFPDRGSPRRDGTRQSSIVRPYIMQYRLEGDVILILRVRHGARLQD